MRTLCGPELTSITGSAPLMNASNNTQHRFQYRLRVAHSLCTTTNSSHVTRGGIVDIATRPKGAEREDRNFPSATCRLVDSFLKHKHNWGACLNSLWLSFMPFTVVTMLLQYFKWSAIPQNLIIVQRSSRAMHGNLCKSRQRTPCLTVRQSAIIHLSCINTRKTPDDTEDPLENGCNRGATAPADTAVLWRETNFPGLVWWFRNCTTTALHNSTTPSLSVCPNAFEPFQTRMENKQRNKTWKNKPSINNIPFYSRSPRRCRDATTATTTLL